jgi:hypothetical protein
VTLRAEIIREIPGLSDEGELPSAEALQAAGEAALADAALLHAVRTACVTTSALTGGEVGDVRAGAVAPTGPAGGYAGMALTVTATLW